MISATQPHSTQSLASLSSAPTAGLTPEALLLYCQSQLGNLDGEVRARMNRQGEGLAAKKVLGELSATLGEPRALKGDEARKFGEQLRTALGTLPEGSPERCKLQAQLDTFESKVIGPHDQASAALTAAEGNLARARAEGNSSPEMLEVLGAEVNRLRQQRDSIQFGEKDFKSLAASVDEMKSQIDDGMELNMISLQSFMSQRQMAVQLTTQILQKLTETAQAVARNL